MRNIYLVHTHDTDKNSGIMVVANDAFEAIYVVEKVLGEFIRGHEYIEVTEFLTEV